MLCVNKNNTSREEMLKHIFQHTSQQNINRPFFGQLIESIIVFQMSFSSTIRRFDVYKKVQSELSEGTNVGGFVSIVTVLTLLFLVFKETGDFFYPDMKTQLRPDDPVTRDEMQITIDIEFPRFPCELVSLDLQDMLMSHHPNIGSITKRRIDKDGKFMEEGNFEILSEPNMHKQYQLVKKAFINQQGCRLMGTFTVKEVPGNFHISCHAYNGLYSNLLHEGVVKRIDTSHTIHELYFGSGTNLFYVQKQFPRAELHRLKGTKKDKTLPANEQHSYYSHYHIDVVPTYYRNAFYMGAKTFQYTSSHNYAQFAGMPAVYFNYAIGGMVVDIYPNRMSLLQFVIQLCAIVGGAYTIASLLDSFLNRLIKPTHEYSMIN